MFQVTVDDPRLPQLHTSVPDNWEIQVAMRYHSHLSNGSEIFVSRLDQPGAPAKWPRAALPAKHARFLCQSGRRDVILMPAWLYRKMRLELQEQQAVQ